MGKKSVFSLGILVGIVLTFVSLFILFWLDEKYHFITGVQVVDVEEVDSIPVDTTLLPGINISEEEFTKEMMKGVQGDYTLEQVDSMQRSWARLDSIKTQKP